MKRETRKLVLHRETLRQLEGLSLRRVFGGTSAQCFAGTGCDCPTGDTGTGSGADPGTRNTLCCSAVTVCGGASVCVCPPLWTE